MMEQGISESLDGRMSDRETRMQTRWTAFERKWEEKIIEPDCKEGTITNAEHRIPMSVQGEMENVWKDRTEGRIRSQRTRSRPLKSELQRLSEEVVCMKNDPI